jgi:hypothetical protein
MTVGGPELDFRNCERTGGERREPTARRWWRGKLTSATVRFNCFPLSLPYRTLHVASLPLARATLRS